MQVTVGIVTKPDRLNWLNELLDVLNEQTFSDFDICIVLASECSDTFEIRSQSIHPIKVVKVPSNASVGMCRNVVLKSADGEVIAFTDDDCLPEPDWLEQGMKVLEDMNIASVTGYVLPVQPVKLPMSLRWLISSTPWNIDQKKEVKSGWGSNLFARKKAALKVGGFDDKFGFSKNRVILGDEQTLGLRLAASGYKTIFDPKVVVRHRIKWSGNRGIVHRAFLDGYTKAILIKKYGKSAIGAAQAKEHTVIVEIIRTGALGIFISSLWILGFLWGIVRNE